jgi:hypothetical protein
VFEGVCRPLKIRVEQLLLSGPALLTTFQILQLLAFYASTLSNLMTATTAAIVAPVATSAEGSSAHIPGDTEHTSAAFESKGSATGGAPAEERQANALVATLQQLRGQAATAFHEAMRAKSGKLLRAVPGAPRSLAAAPEFGVIMETVVEVVEAHEGSMGSGEPPQYCDIEFDHDRKQT